MVELVPVLDDIDERLEQRQQNDVFDADPLGRFRQGKAHFQLARMGAGPDVINRIAAVERFRVDLRVAEVSDEHFLGTQGQNFFVASRRTARAPNVEAGSSQLGYQDFPLVAVCRRNQNLHRKSPWMA